MENNKDIKKHDWGYELIWASTENYCGKILVFEKPSKTDFLFSDSIERSWFVNVGKFKFSWIDTKTGNIYQQEVIEGGVFTADKLVPYSIECASANGSLAEVNNGEKTKESFIVIKKEVLQ